MRTRMSNVGRDRKQILIMDRQRESWEEIDIMCIGMSRLVFLLTNFFLQSFK